MKSIENLKKYAISEEETEQILGGRRVFDRPIVAYIAAYILERRGYEPELTVMDNGSICVDW